MASNAQKTPITRSLNDLAIQKALEMIEQQGRSLPCSVTQVSGQIVTVKFEVQSGYTLPQVTIPLATSVYDYLPIQAGDLGVARAADAYLGGVSGLGGGVATLTQRANLTALVFEPIAHKNWSAPNPEQRVVQGPAGVLLRDLGATTTIDLQPNLISMGCGNASITITPTEITLAVGAQTLVLTATGAQIAGHDFLSHEHVGVQTGVSNTGTVA